MADAKKTAKKHADAAKKRRRRKREDEAAEKSGTKRVPRGAKRSEVVGNATRKGTRLDESGSRRSHKATDELKTRPRKETLPAGSKLYHGTSTANVDKILDKIDPPTGGRFSGGNHLGDGFYTSTDSGGAEAYGSSHGGGYAVIEYETTQTMDGTARTPSSSGSTQDGDFAANGEEVTPSEYKVNSSGYDKLQAKSVTYYDSSGNVIDKKML